MKILYILGFLPTYVAREVEAMAAGGSDISVILPERENSSETADFWSAISKDPESNSVSISRTLKFKYLTCPIRQLIQPFFQSLRFPKALIKSIRESEFRYFIVASSAVIGMASGSIPDVIHTHFAHDNAHIARIMARLLKIPYSVTTHAADIFVPRCKTRLRRVLAGASMVFTISKYNVSHLLELGVSRNNIIVSRLGLDTSILPERKTPSDPPLIVCTASGLVPKKGVPVLIQAVRMLQDTDLVFRLIVIGSDPDGSKLQELRKTSSGLPIEFPGVLTSETTLTILSKASVFVLPCVEAENGDKDGIPVALIEAMGMGIPCISTEISGIPELIENDVSGILVKPGSPRQLAEALSLLLAGRDIAERLGSEGRNKVEANHSPDKQAYILTNAFDQMQKGL